jgi:hypothetical protein
MIWIALPNPPRRACLRRASQHRVRSVVARAARPAVSAFMSTFLEARPNRARVVLTSRDCSSPAAH